MAIKASTGFRNGMLTGGFSAVGTDFVLKIRTGSPPANAAAADSGTTLATMTGLNVAAASGGTISMTGTWQDLLGDAQGTAGHWRLYATDGTTCHLQGTITEVGGGGDMEIINDNIEVNQPVQVTSFTLTAPNA